MSVKKNIRAFITEYCVVVKCNCKNCSAEVFSFLIFLGQEASPDPHGKS